MEINNNHKPVFIIGLPRSASKWIMHSLNLYSECCIIHELHVNRLWRIGNEKRLKKLNILEIPNKVEILRNQINSGKFIGCYWSLKDCEYSFDSLDESEIDEALSIVENGRSLITAFTEVSKSHYSKNRPGARHPVHFLYLNKLFDWFPNSQVLFLTRSVSEIAKSWRKKVSNREKNRSKRLIMMVLFTVHSYINGLLAKLVIWKWNSDPRFCKISYNDLITSPSSTFQKMCDHLNISFDPRMADDSIIFDSAYIPDSEKPFNGNIVWKNTSN